MVCLLLAMLQGLIPDITTIITRAVSLSVQCAGKISYTDLAWLHTDGRWIKDEQGNTVRFLGVGRLDMMVYYDDAHAPWGPQAVLKGMETEANYDLLKSTGANLLRLGLSRGAILENPQVLPLIDQIVAWCKERGIRVDFDLMWWTRNRPSNGSLDEWSEIVGPNPPQAWIDFFTMLAERYINEPTVCMFALLNEPRFYKAVSLTTDEMLAIWKDRVTQVAKAIHRINPNLLISVNIPGFDLRKWESPSGIDYWIDEPNIVYAFHHYYRSDLIYWQPKWATSYRDGNFDVAKQLYEQWMVQRYFWVAEQRNLPVWMEESGVWLAETNYPNSLKVMWDAYQILGNHSIGFAQWVWNGEWNPRDPTTTLDQISIDYSMLHYGQTTLNEIGQQFADYIATLQNIT